MREHQQYIINELGSVPTIVPEREIELRSRFLADHLAQAGLNGFVLGISGGQDSLLAGILAKRAVLMRQTEGFDAKFHAVLLPYGTQSDRSDALLACEVIQPDVTHDIDIKPAVDALAVTFDTTGRPLSDFDKGNVKARMRMIAQYAIASQHKLLVIGTDHAAEAVTGFFTKFGDGGADILPLSGLTKRQGRQMLQTMGAPELFTTKPPTADLLDARPGQTDENELGITYAQLDDYLEGNPTETTTSIAIEQRFIQTSHKRALPVSYV